MARSEIAIGAMVLAAGLSRRMGQNKLLSPLLGKPVVRHVVDTLNAVMTEPVLVVTGHQASMVQSALTGASVCLVPAPDYAAGMSQSVKAGILAVPAHWDAVLVCLADMPLLSRAMILQLQEMAHIDRIIVPHFQHQQGNPILWGRAFFGALADLDGDRGAKSVLADCADHIIPINWPDADPFRDVDTPAAMDAVRSVMVAKGGAS